MADEMKTGGGIAPPADAIAQTAANALPADGVQGATAAAPASSSITPTVTAAMADKGTRETVLEVKRWTDTLFSFKTTRPVGYTFTPGEYSRLGVLFKGETHPTIWRAYSIVSAPDQDFLEYYGVIVPDGLFTTKLKAIRPGDPIWIDRMRFGFMTANRFADGEDLWMLATGTGLGPFISMLRDPAVWKSFRTLVLVHGVRHASELSYQEELRALQASAPVDGARLLLATASTRDTENQPGSLKPASFPDHLSGRITTLLASGELEKSLGLAMNVESSRVMLCGNPDMIADTRALLHERGMKPCRRATPGQFVTENYW